MTGIDLKAPPKPAKRWRLSLYLGDSTKSMIASAENASGRLDAICRRFQDVCRLTQPNTWSADEWIPLVLALKNGVGLVEYDAWQAVFGWAHTFRDVMQSVYDIDPTEVAVRLRDSGDIANIVMVEWVERYWQQRSDMTHAEKLYALRLISLKDMREWNKRYPGREAKRRRYEASAAARESTQPVESPLT